MQSLTIALNTLTPLWTGGIGKDMDRLHETGIIGSLRWWYEVMLRGLGGKACDPTENPCGLNAASFKQSSAETLGLRLNEAGLCDVCQVFGATGWKRRFRLSAEQMEMAPAGPSRSIETTGERYNRSGKRPKWYFKGQGQGGKFQITLTSLNPDFDPHLLLAPLVLIGKYGGLAAKTQLGYGWVTFTPPTDFDPISLLTALHITPSTPDPDLPALDNMFFTQVNTNEPGITATLNAKYDVRKLFRTTFHDTELRHFICGTVRGERRQGAKIFFSQPVNGRMRVWGWVPHNLPPAGVDRDEIVAAIHKTLSGIGKFSYWREFDSPRDTVHPSETNRQSFICSLFEEAT